VAYGREDRESPPAICTRVALFRALCTGLTAAGRVTNRHWKKPPRVNALFPTCIELDHRKGRGPERGLRLNRLRANALSAFPGPS